MKPNQHQPSCFSEPLNKEQEGFSWVLILFFVIAFVILGLSVAVSGPSLIFLEEISYAWEDEVALVFTGRSVGALGGWLLCTALLEKDASYSGGLFGFGFFVLSLINVCIGFSRHLWWLLAAFTLQGCFMTVSAQGCLAYVSTRGGPSKRKVHQLLVFCSILGCAVAPALMIPLTYRIQIFANNETLPLQNPVSPSPLKLITSTPLPHSDIIKVSRYRRSIEVIPLIEDVQLSSKNSLEISNTVTDNNNSSGIPDLGQLKALDTIEKLTSPASNQSSAPPQPDGAHQSPDSELTHIAPAVADAAYAKKDSPLPRHSDSTSKPKASEVNNGQRTSTEPDIRTTPVPKKPTVVDAIHLNQDQNSADGSNTAVLMKKVEEEVREGKAANNIEPSDIHTEPVNEDVRLSSETPLGHNSTTSSTTSSPSSPPTTTSSVTKEIHLSDNQTEITDIKAFSVDETGEEVVATTKTKGTITDEENVDNLRTTTQANLPTFRTVVSEEMTHETQNGDENKSTDPKKMIGDSNAKENISISGTTDAAESRKFDILTSSSTKTLPSNGSYTSSSAPTSVEVSTDVKKDEQVTKTEILKPVSSTLSAIESSTVPVDTTPLSLANASVTPTLSHTEISSTTFSPNTSLMPTTVPRKPSIVDAAHLNQDRSIADGSDTAVKMKETVEDVRLVDKIDLKDVSAEPAKRTTPSHTTLSVVDSVHKITDKESKDGDHIGADIDRKSKDNSSGIGVDIKDDEKKATVNDSAADGIKTTAFYEIPAEHTPQNNSLNVPVSSVNASDVLLTTKVPAILAETTQDVSATPSSTPYIISSSENLTNPIISPPPGAKNKTNSTSISEQNATPPITDAANLPRNATSSEVVRNGTEVQPSLPDKLSIPSEQYDVKVNGKLRSNDSYSLHSSYNRNLNGFKPNQWQHIGGQRHYVIAVRRVYLAFGLLTFMAWFILLPFTGIFRKLHSICNCCQSPTDDAGQISETLNECPTSEHEALLQNDEADDVVEAVRKSSLAALSPLFNNRVSFLQDSEPVPNFAALRSQQSEKVIQILSQNAFNATFPSKIGPTPWPLVTWPKEIWLLLAAFLLAGLETTYGAFLHSFALRNLHWTPYASLWVTAVFWSGDLIGRLFGTLACPLADAGVSLLQGAVFLPFSSDSKLKNCHTGKITLRKKMSRRKVVRIVFRMAGAVICIISSGILKHFTRSYFVYESRDSGVLLERWGSAKDRATWVGSFVLGLGLGITASSGLNVCNHLGQRIHLAGLLGQMFLPATAGYITERVLHKNASKTLSRTSLILSSLMFLALLIDFILRLIRPCSWWKKINDCIFTVYTAETRPSKPGLKRSFSQLDNSGSPSKCARLNSLVSAPKEEHDESVANLVAKRHEAYSASTD